MVTESYCSYEVSKLLKEKGFNEEIETLITENGTIYHLDENSVDRKSHQTIANSKVNPYSTDVTCPTHQMAVAWLREEKNIFIAISIGYVGKESKQKYFWCPCVLKEDHIEYPMEHNDGSVDEMANTFNEAVEDALKYSLTKLV